MSNYLSRITRILLWVEVILMFLLIFAGTRMKSGYEATIQQKNQDIKAKESTIKNQQIIIDTLVKKISILSEAQTWYSINLDSTIIFSIDTALIYHSHIP